MVDDSDPVDLGVLAGPFLAEVRLLIRLATIVAYVKTMTPVRNIQSSMTELFSNPHEGSSTRDWASTLL